MKISLLRILSWIVFIGLMFGCQKELVYDLSNNNNGQDSTITYTVDDATQVMASVNGVIVDENNQPLAGATVRCGSQSMTTNSMGTFIFRNIPVSKNNGTISISKDGYYKGTRNFLAATGKIHFVRVQMIKQILTSTLPSANGGTVVLGNGASIAFPANAFSYPNGNAYTGDVQVYAKYISPNDPALHLIFPGDLRGIRKNGFETVLSTYGIIGAELYDNNGNKLVITNGIKATIEFPVPSGVQPAVGDSIALWHFDEARSRWLEQGKAVKAAGKLRAEVSGFSFWSINESAGFVRMTCVIMNSLDTTPVGNQLVRLSVPGTSMTCFGYTACTGFVMSGVPVGQPIHMEIEVSNACGMVLDTRDIGPFTSHTDLDTIWITAPATTYTLFTGYIKNCQGNVAANGYISLFTPTSGTYIFEADSATGYFSLPVYSCQNATLTYSYQVNEFGTGQQSQVIDGSTTSHIVDLGNVLACSTPPSVDVYVFGSETAPGPNSVVKYWKNGVVTNVTDGSLSSYTSRAFITPNNDIYIAGSEWDAAGSTSNAKLWVNGVQTDLSGFSFMRSNATEVFVNGTDVYVSYDMSDIATGFSVARLWKNGTSTTISPNESANFHATCVYVSGSDVYVGGTRTPQASIVARAFIWKNGVIQYLNAGTNNSNIRKILVNGSDVYAVGQDNLGANGTGRAVIWKNGVATYLTDGINSDAMANDIFIDGTDIYVCGRKSSNGSGEFAQLWKNGVATVLSASGSNGIAQSVYVKNGDVYVTESELMGGPVRIWKNNIPTLLTTGSNFNSVSTVIVK